MNDKKLPDFNKKFIECCKTYNLEAVKFLDMANNFFSCHKKIATEKSQIILNSASILLNSDHVSKVSELTIKHQKLFSENEIKRIKNKENLKIKTLYEKMTNIVLHPKNKENKEIFIGEYFNNVNGFDEKNGKRSRKKMINFELHNKKNEKNEEKKYIIIDGNENRDKSLKIKDFYKELMRSFSV